MSKRILFALLGLLEVLVLALGATAWWLVSTQDGLDWALARAVAATGGRLGIEDARGSLAGGMQLARVAFSGDGARFEARDVSGRIALLSIFAGTLRVEALRIESAEAALQEAKADAAGEPPAQLALPLALEVPEASVARLRILKGDETYAASDLRLSYSGGPVQHAVRDASAQTPWGRLSFDGTLAALPPFQIEARAALDGGIASVSAFARLLPFAEQRIQALQASAEGLDLSRIDAALPRTSLKLELEGAAASGGPLAGTLSALNSIAAPLDRGALPVRSLRARFELQGAALVLEGLEARAGGGELRGKGRLAPGAAQLDLQLARIDLRAIRSNLRATHLAGNVSLALGPKRQSAKGTLAQDDMKLAFDASRSGDVVTVRSFRAEAGGGLASGSGELRLGETLSANGQLRFSGFDPSRFGDYPEGSVNGHAELSGALGEPRRVRARWTIADSRLDGKTLASRGSARLVGERLLDLDAFAQWGANRLQAKGDFGAPQDEMAWTLAANELPLAGLSGPLRAQGNARGGLGEHRLSLTVRTEGLELRTELRGGWLGAASGWKGELAQLRLDGRYPLVLMDVVPLHISTREIHAGELVARLGDGRIHVQALDWTPGRLSTRGQFSGLPAAWLIGPAGLADELRSTLLLDGEWSLASTPELDGRVSVRRSSGDLAVTRPAPLQLGLGEVSLAASFDRGAASMTVHAGSRLGTLQARGSAAALSRDADMQFEAKLELEDLRVLVGALPAHVRIAGRASAALEGRGTFDAPQLAGRISAEGLGVNYPPYGIYLEDGRLRASLEGDALRVEELSLRGGDGRFVAHGTLPLLGEGEAALRWTASGLRLLGRPDMRLVVSGEGAARLEEQRVALQGSVRIDSAYIERALHRLPELDDDIVVIGRGGKDETLPSRARPPVDLDLLVDLGPRFKLRAAGFDGMLKGEVHVATVGGGELRAFGRVSAYDATFRAYGRNLQVAPGIVTFDGPIDNPALQITAWRRNQEVEAGVRITGNLRQPRAELVSEPPLPEGAKLSWLVLGRAPTDATGADLALLQTAAAAALGRGDSVPITTRIADAVGLDELALRGSAEMAGRVAAFGKRISERLYVTYEQGVGAAAQSLVKIDLSLTERISLRAQTGTTSGTGLYYRYSWD